MASQGKLVSIVAWSLVGLLLIGAGALAFLRQQEVARAAGWQEAFLQVGTTAGLEGLAPETLKDAAALPDLLQKVQTALQAKQQELVGTKEALATAQTEASDVKTELATLSQSIKDQTAKVVALSNDLTAKDTALAEAKALAEQATLTATNAQAAADKQKTELESSLASLKAQMAEESARLQAELETARQQVQVPAAAPADISQSPTEIVPLLVADESTTLPEQKMVAKDAPSALTVEEDEGLVIGQSQMFSLIRYSEVNQTLAFRLLDGQNLRYREVPLDVYSQLVGDPERLDMNYRFKVQGAFKSVPPDSIVVRKFWKWKRRHPAKGDVRVVTPELLQVENIEATATPAVQATGEVAP